MPPVRIKICGITTAEDARLAAMLGAHAVGLNFYPQSPRHVEPRSAAAIVQCLPPFVDAVGVFVGMPARQVCAMAYQIGLGAAQCFAPDIAGDTLAPFRLITAFRLKDAADLRAIAEHVQAAQAAGRAPAAVLVDAHVAGQWGGTGQTAPWDLLAGFDAGVPLVLAGGLTPDNVAEAIRIVRPFAVDVASGVEAAPGRKDPDKLQRFIDAVQSAG